MVLKRIRLLSVVGGLLLSLSAGQAGAMVTVDADAFAVGTDISNAFAGVTLSAVGIGWNGPTGIIVAVDPLAHLEPFSAST